MNAAWYKSEHYAVEHYPNLERGTARGDGDCFMHSAILHSGDELARQMNVPERELTPSLLRKHLARALTRDLLRNDERGEFLRNVVGSSSFSPMNQSEFNAAAGEISREVRPGLLDDKQRAFIAAVARDRSYNNEAGDLMPDLLAHAFQGLQVIVHGKETRPDNEASYTYKGKDPDVSRRTIRLYRDANAAHYEPVFERAASAG